MKLKLTIISLISTFALQAQVIKGEAIKKWSASRPDGHAPISVMGDHMHGKGEWMFSYRYMYMNMQDLKQGNDDTSFNSALVDYMVTPTKMPMHMHMLGAMYAPNDKITLMTMFNYTAMSMDHITRMGGTFTTEASGFGDIKIAMLYKLFNKKRQTLHGQLGLSLPTGSITQNDVTPVSAPNLVELPYPMQIGSGTFDANVALTYLCQGDLFSYGAQLKGVIRIGENKRDYALGNSYSFNNWLAIKANNYLSFSTRIEGVLIGEIRGSDANLNPDMVITADTNNSGGTYINSGIGVNTYIFKGSLKNLRFGFEFSYPLYQNLNGIQLKTKEAITLGTQYSF